MRGSVASWSMQRARVIGRTWCRYVLTVVDPTFLNLRKPSLSSGRITTCPRHPAAEPTPAMQMSAPTLITAQLTVSCLLRCGRAIARPRQAHVTAVMGYVALFHSLHHKSFCVVRSQGMTKHRAT